ncbi:MAG: hypothetical protein ACXWDE_04705, partial [Aeromicrobium sp.]
TTSVDASPPWSSQRGREEHGADDCQGNGIDVIEDETCDAKQDTGQDIGPRDHRDAPDPVEQWAESQAEGNTDPGRRVFRPRVA